jgi:hypothetical protein
MEATPRPSRPCDALGVPVALPQHPNEHRPERPVLLAVDQQLAKARLPRGIRNRGSCCRIQHQGSAPDGRFDSGNGMAGASDDPLTRPCP